MNDKIILPDSPEAATFRTDIKGWVSRDGRFFGYGPDAEKLARLAGCTHRGCPGCTLPTPRGRTYCEPCRETLAVNRYRARETIHWSEETPVYSEVADEFFSDKSELADYCDEHQCTPESLRLLVCRQVALSEVDENYWLDDLPDGTLLPREVSRALEALNATLRNATGLGFEPTKYAAIIEGKS